ncbi:DUF504 domain-containing protein [Candidatus Woesearchaeota archaeon]|nr:DUF504 domain-containing protein [Candidatus Woesearchaeota archaeon]
MVLREQDRHFLWSLYSAVAIIFAWKGIWEGLYEIPYIGHAFVFLFIGFAMLTFSGLIFKEFDPLGGVEKAITKTLHTIDHHPQKNQFQIKYHDKIKNKDMVVNAQQIRTVEKNTVVIEDPHKKQEIFIPAHRITEVLFKGGVYWRQ